MSQDTFSFLKILNNNILMNICIEEICNFLIYLLLFLCCLNSYQYILLTKSDSQAIFITAMGPHFPEYNS